MRPLPQQCKNRTIQIDETSSIGEAVWLLSAITGRRWTISEFYAVVDQLSLPIFAVVPLQTTVVAHTWVDGKRVVTPHPLMSARYLTLLRDEIRQLQLGESVITHRLAWISSDTEYRSWNEIKQYRAAHHRVLQEWEVEGGEWMGQSETYFADHLVRVSPHTTLVVPRHTIAEIAQWAAGPFPNPSYLAHHHSADMVVEGEPEEVSTSLVTACVPAMTADVGSSALIATKVQNNWDNFGLQRLLSEYGMPGATHQSLGEKYGVTRQCIAKQLRKAQKLFAVKKANAFSSLHFKK